MIIVDVQRAGPSTGLPTKTEQADLLRRCSAATGSPRCRSWPRPRRRTASTSPWRPRGSPSGTGPGDRAVRHVPAELLEPWKLPEVDVCRRSSRPSPTRERRRSCRMLRDEQLARALGEARHARVSSTGSVASSARTAPATSATTPENHERMTHLREAKVEASRRHPGARGRRPRRRRRAADPGVGFVARHDPRVVRGCAARAKVATAHLVTSIRSRQHRRRGQGLSEGADPRDEHGPAVQLIRAKFLVMPSASPRSRGSRSSRTTGAGDPAGAR